MAVAPPALVVGTERTPLPFGLFSAAAVRPNADRWESGVQWEQTVAPPAMGTSFDCDVPADPLDLDAYDCAIGEASVFTVYGYAHGNPVGMNPEVASAKAIDHLTIREEARVEQALWTADLANSPSLRGAGVAVGPGAQTMPTGLAALEDAIATQYGSLGVIHLTRYTAMKAIADDLVESRNGRLYTVLGTPVVAGAGYDGSGPAEEVPAAGTAWAYATGPVFVYRSEVFAPSSRPGDTLNRGTNTLLAVAERTYLLGFDDFSASVLLTVE